MKFMCLLLSALIQVFALIALGMWLGEQLWWSELFGHVTGIVAGFCLGMFLFHMALMDVQESGWSFAADDWAVGRLALLRHMAQKEDGPQEKKP